jgi:voltage-gated potassium channel Kch
MAAWRRETEALLGQLLGGADVLWLGWGSAPGADAAGATAVSLIGLDPSPADRRRVFAELAAALAPASVLIVVDHNRPRDMRAALAALAAEPRVPGSSPVECWRRLARPTAREVQAAGFRVEKLRLVAGERVQIVVATRT